MEVRFRRSGRDIKGALPTKRKRNIESFRWGGKGRGDKFEGYKKITFISRVNGARRGGKGEWTPQGIA